jgi:23S rRNA pseudouridine955/2504/2580 synthase
LVYRWLRKGEVRVNKGRVKQTYRVQAGDIIRIPPFQLEQENTIQYLKPSDLSYLEDKILYEDGDFLIMNKPSGLAVHGGTGIDSGLIERLRVLRPTAKKLELVHRLDRDTSGCIIIAKKYSILTYFHEQLREHKIKKLYHALVVGQWPKAVHKIDQPLKKNVASSGERFTRVDPEGKESLTTVRILEKYNDTTLIEARPHTGRTHQLRVHLKYGGCSIVGDSKYGQKDINSIFQKKGVKRLLLHANQLTFDHPKSGEKISFMAPYDKQFKYALQCEI